MPRSKASTAAAADSAKDPQSGVDELTFEAALGELETIVEKMEQGELPLQESLHAYQRGAALVGRCREALDKVNQEVSVLEGNLLKPMAVGDSNDEDVS